MIKRKWILAAAVSAVLGAALFTGCGAKEAGPDAATKTESTQEPEKSANVGVRTAKEGAAAENSAETSDAAAENSAETSGAAAENSAETSGAGEAGKNDVFGEFKTLTLYGEDADQDIFADAELTMVNIWGTFCGPCVRELPELGELSHEYADKGLQVVGIITDVSQVEDEVALEIVEKTKADYTHLIISESLYYNVLSNASAVPTTIFIDKDGNQVGSPYSGSKNKKQWTEVIEEMLGKAES